jgi:hypothetical protein
MRRQLKAAAVLLVVLLGGCGYGGGLEDARQEIRTSPMRITVNPADAPHDVVTYLDVRKNPEQGASTEGGVRVKSQDDLGKLHGASADFKSFLGWQLSANVAAVKAGLAARGQQALPARCDLAARITVWGVAPTVAMGREWWCTRNADEAIWVKDGNTWRVAARMRGGWDCSVLGRYRVPADITAAVCWEKDGRTVRRYDGPS